MTEIHSAPEGSDQHDKSANAEVERLQRIQTAAEVWLGVLTTLLSLLGSVVLIKGGDLITEITGNKALQWILVSLVGLVFAIAVLAVIAGSVATWGGLKLSSDRQGSEPTSELRRWQKPILTVVLRVALMPKADRYETYQLAEERKPRWRAERNRIYLHASRTLGVAAAAFIALLAIVAVIAGTLFPVPSEMVVVHHGVTTCVPATKQYSGVTVVVPVNSC